MVGLEGATAASGRSSIEIADGGCDGHQAVACLLRLDYRMRYAMPLLLIKSVINGNIKGRGRANNRIIKC